MISLEVLLALSETFDEVDCCRMARNEVSGLRVHDDDDDEGHSQKHVIVGRRNAAGA